MKILFILALSFLNYHVHAQTVDLDQLASEQPTDYVSKPFSEEDFKTQAWTKEYTNIIVINKANEGEDKQTLRLYTDGKLKEFTRVSTGRETFEKGCKAGQIPKRDHCSNHAYWSTTPVGYFDVDTLDEHYFSNLWETWMPYAVFFESGIATHQAPGGTESKLGSRASGGCVRTHPSMAPRIFALVKNAGKGLVPVIKRDGTLKKTAQGDVVREQGYKTLVIVQNIVK